MKIAMLFATVCRLPSMQFYTLPVQSSYTGVLFFYFFIFFSPLDVLDLNLDANTHNINCCW